MSLIFLVCRLSPRTCAETLGEEQHNLAKVGHPCCLLPPPPQIDGICQICRKEHNATPGTGSRGGRPSL